MWLQSRVITNARALAQPPALTKGSWSTSHSLLTLPGFLSKTSLAQDLGTQGAQGPNCGHHVTLLESEKKARWWDSGHLVGKHLQHLVTATCADWWAVSGPGEACAQDAQELWWEPSECQLVARCFPVGTRLQELPDVWGHCWLVGNEPQRAIRLSGFGSPPANQYLANVRTSECRDSPGGAPAVLKTRGAQASALSATGGRWWDLG